MKKHEFYAKYANVPLPKRVEPITVGGITLNGIFNLVRENDRKIQRLEAESTQVIGLAISVLNPKK